jgi:signal transduction histidine kinase
MELTAELAHPVAEVPATVVETTAAVARGLAAIGRATTATAVYHAACQFALRLPGVAGVTVFRRDERGLLGVAYAPPGASIPPHAIQPAAAALHRRWIAGHKEGSPLPTPWPCSFDDSPELLVVPFVRDELFLGALVIAGTDRKPPGASKAARVAASSIGVAVAQALEAVTLRQRLELSMTKTDHDAALAAERKRISHELHDGPTQELALAGIILDRLIRYLREDERGAADARQARELIDRSITGMRQTLTRLRQLAPEGLSATGPLRELLAEIEPGPNSPALEVDFSNVSGVHLTHEVERTLVGIVREALNNVRKHAAAESVQLEVRRAGHEVEIAVVDDGVGFDGMDRDGHFGLEQIRELAEGMGGRVEIGSLPGIGTSVRAWIPLPGVAAAEPDDAWVDALALDWAETGPRYGS